MSKFVSQLLAREFVAYSVRAESPITDVKDLVNLLKGDPGAIPVDTSSSTETMRYIGRQFGVIKSALRDLGLTRAPSAR